MVTVVMVEKRPADIRAEERQRPAKSPRPRAAATAPTAPAAKAATPGAGSGAVASQPFTPSSPAGGALSANERFRRISVCAYFKAEQRGFEPGHMWEDWLAAEREVDAAAIAATEPVPAK